MSLFRYPILQHSEASGVVITGCTTSQGGISTQEDEALWPGRETRQLSRFSRIRSHCIVITLILSTLLSNYRSFISSAIVSGFLTALEKPSWYVTHTLSSTGFCAASCSA